MTEKKRRKITTLSDIYAKKYIFTVGAIPKTIKQVVKEKVKVSMPWHHKLLINGLGYGFLAGIVLFGVAIIVVLVALIVFLIKYMTGVF